MVRKVDHRSPVAAPPTPISAATEQQQHDHNNQDQFHRNSPLTPTSVRRAPKYSTAPSGYCSCNLQSRSTCSLGCEQFSSGPKRPSLGPARDVVRQERGIGAAARDNLLRQRGCPSLPIRCHFAKS